MNTDKPLASQCCDLPPDKVCQHFFSCLLDEQKWCRIHDRRQKPAAPPSSNE